MISLASQTHDLSDMDHGARCRTSYGNQARYWNLDLEYPGVLNHRLKIQIMIESMISLASQTHDPSDMYYGARPRPGYGKQPRHWNVDLDHGPGVLNHRLRI